MHSFITCAFNVYDMTWTFLWGWGFFYSTLLYSIYLSHGVSLGVRWSNGEWTSRIGMDGQTYLSIKSNVRDLESNTLNMRFDDGLDCLIHPSINPSIFSLVGVRKRSLLISWETANSAMRSRVWFLAGTWSAAQHRVELEEAHAQQSTAHGSHYLSIC